MKKIKILTIFCVTLVALNLFLIATALLEQREHRHGRPEEKKDIVIHELQLDQVQIAKYEKMIHWHRNQIREADGRIMDLKNKLYAPLDNPNPNQMANDSLMAEIGKVQVEIEHIHYKHFQDIKSLCRKEQLPYYHDMTTRIADIFSNPKPGR
ncbi:periplasmic heavy metal sensor [Flavobacterium pallidum]|uniref:Periplasmic heavy metal sensor n=1 Tax=Flavobacterium pallidum TaxID=2172098 RepID=A0A2S1SEG3_9FLAO|nr:periplasmic heavy metal sensor [Flavobacterium pallidum]AWI24790.1 hypothetical protein HYN49_02175 [Flavobacterium pallidum]